MSTPNETIVFAKDVDGDFTKVAQLKRGSPYYSFQIAGTWTSAILYASQFEDDASFVAVKTFTEAEILEISFMAHYKLVVVGGVNVFAGIDVILPQDKQ